MQFNKTLLIRFCILALILCCGAVGAYIAATLKYQQLDQNVINIRKVTQSQQADTQSLLLLNARARNIVALAPLRLTPVKKLESLVGLLNDKIIFSQWEYNDANLSFKITGTAQTRSALLEFKEILDSSDDFTKVVLPLESLAIPVNVPFEMTFTIKN